jgi:hypothetical protein
MNGHPRSLFILQQFHADALQKYDFELPKVNYEAKKYCFLKLHGVHRCSILISFEYGKLNQIGYYRNHRLSFIFFA